MPGCTIRLHIPYRAILKVSLHIPYSAILKVRLHITYGAIFSRCNIFSDWHCAIISWTFFEDEGITEYNETIKEKYLHAKICVPGQTSISAKISCL